MKKNPNGPMLLPRFSELLDAFGADPARWPEAERAAAQALLESEPRARELQRAALELDAALDVFEVPEPSAQLRARVLEIPIRHAAQAPARQRAWFGWGLAALAVVPCALGFLSGTLTADPTANDQDDGWSEVAAVTLLGEMPDEEWP